MITNELVNIIDEIRGASTPKEKQKVLQSYKNIHELQQVLYYTFSPYLKYGLSEKTIGKFTATGSSKCKSFEELLNVLSKSNINDTLRQEFTNFISQFDEKIANLMIQIVCKDLKLGISATTINKVWKNLIPQFSLQLAAKFDNVTLDKDEYIWITEKFDGIRCVCIIDNDKNINFFTRQGKEIFGLKEIERKIANLNLANKVIDGELLFTGDAKDSGERYRKTTKIVNSKDEDKRNVMFNIFDTLTLDEFKAGESKALYEERRKLLNTIPNDNIIKTAPVLYEGTNHLMVINILNQMISELKEGCMVNRNHVYQCKRTKSLLKVKKMQSYDLKIVGYEEGRGENEGKLGAFVVEYRNNTVNVGSGYSKEDREYFWQHKDELIGRVIEIQFFEESKNADGKYSLRFPVFLQLREEGKEVSYN